MRRPAAALALAGLTVLACAGGPARPAPLDTANDHCAWCRMTASQVHFAAQIAAPLEEPIFFDDVGCLRDWLREHPERPEGAVAFVADHATGEWVRADTAVYTRQESLATPMGSHLIAHRDAAARESDPDARGGTPLSDTDVFGPAGPPGGAP